MKKNLLSKHLLASICFILFLSSTTFVANATDRYVPTGYATIQDAINASSAGDVIHVAPGTYPIGTTINVTVPITIDGGSSATTKLQTSGSNSLFSVTVPNVIIKNLEIEKTDITAVNQLIYVQGNNFELNNTIIHGLYAVATDPLSRALVIAVGIQGINIHDNIFKALRQPAYINNGVSGTVNNNFTAITRGWVVVSDATVTFSGNTWGTGANVNKYDIVLINQSGSLNLYPDIVTISGNNNDAIIENQHVSYPSAILSIVHVQVGAILAGSDGSILNPYPTIGQSVPRVALGGKVLVASGLYNEQVVINKGSRYLGVGATKPIINFSVAPAGRPTLFDVTAPNVTIDNFDFRVDLSKVGSAVLASASNIDNLTIKNNDVNPYRSAASYGTGYGLRNAFSINYGAYRVGGASPINLLVNNNTVSYTISGNPSISGNSGAGFRAAVAVDEGTGTFTNNTLRSVNQDIQLRFANGGNVVIQNNILNGGGVETAEYNGGSGTTIISNNTFNAAFANVAAANTAVLRLKNNQVNRYYEISGNKFYDAEWSVSMENFKNVSLKNNEFTPLAGSTTFHHVTVNTKSISTNSATIVQTQINAEIRNNIFKGSGASGGTALGFYNHDNDNASFGLFDVHENSFAAGIATDIYSDGQSGASNTSTFPLYNGNIGTNPGAITTMAPWTASVNATCNWYGTTDNATIASKVSGNVTYIPYLTNGTDNDGATGFQPVPNSCSGPQPSISFTATTTNGSTGSTSNGTPSTVSINFCAGDYFTFSGYSSNPAANVGVLETHTASPNVTYNLATVGSGNDDLEPSTMPGFFSSTYGPYGLSSGTTGTIDQTYTPYYDVDNSNSYTTGDILGTPVTLHYNIYAAPTQANCPANITQNTDNNRCDAVVTYNVSFNGDNTTVTYSFSGATSGSGSGTGSGSTFNKGTTTVTVTSSNSCGIATCSFTVKVEDHENPTITCPASQTVNPTSLSGATVTYTAPTGMDNCPGATTTRTSGPASGSTFPIGTTTVTYKVTDASGNSASCSFTVTVTDPYCDKNEKDKKVYVCHSGKTLCISVNAVNAHLGHGDYLGSCGNSSITTARMVQGAITKEEGKPEIASYKISNYPNPFGSTTKIQYSLPYDSKVSIKVYDMLGRDIATLVSGDRKAGTYNVDFNSTKLGAGNYYYKLTAISKEKTFTQTGKMIRIK